MPDCLKYNHRINYHKAELKMYVNPLNQLSFCNILIKYLLECSGSSLNMLVFQFLECKSG